MGSNTEHKIPVIYFSEENFKPGSDSWVLASKQVRHGLEEYGCFEIIYDKFPLELHNSMFGAAKDLHDLPEETKMRSTSKRPGSIGYIPQRPKIAPLYESIGIDSPNTPEGAEYFTNVMWPQGNDTFREAVHSFSKRLVELYERAIRMVFENYGVDIKRFNPLMESAFHMLRFLRYRARQTNESNVGLDAHTDANFAAILHQHQVEGLQIKTKDHQWIDVKPSPSSFIFLVGDGLMVWSNDRVCACEHRAIIKENKVRYCIGLFTIVKGLVHVPEELVDEDHPLRYKPFDNFGFLRFFVSGEAIKKCTTAHPIKAFCGID